MTDRAERPGSPSPGWFVPALATISVLGAGAWVLYALVVDIPRLPFSDAREYHHLADGLANGLGYVRAGDRVDFGILRESANYPPLFPAVLAIASVLGLDTFAAHQGVAALVAATSIPLVGLLGRRVGGPVVGLLAAALAAVHPMLFQTGAAMMAEALYLPLVLGLLLATLRALDRGGWRWWAAAGVLAGLAALTRGEGLVLGAIVAVAALVAQVREDRRRALAAAGAVAAGLLLVVVPWSVERSLATGGPVLVSANQQTVLAGANCDVTYDGGFRGWWVFSCFSDALREGDTEAEIYRDLTSTAVDYAMERPAELPGVATVRALRLWGLYDIDAQVEWEATEGRRAGVQRVGWAFTLALVPFAVGGLLLLRRRRGPWALLLAVVAMVTVNAATTYGNQRFRIAAEPVLVVLAALGAVALVDWLRRGRPRPVDGNEESTAEGSAARNERLEGLRAVAAFAVVGTHIGFASGATFRSDLGAYLARMDIGVAIFFVLSGYLLFRPFVRADLAGQPPPRVLAYLWRRGLRIVPAYWLALLAIPLLLGITKIRSVADLVIYGGFLQIYDHDRALSGITQAWSLCTELSFYVFLPLYAAALRRTGARRLRAHVVGLVVLYAASVVFRAWLEVAEPSIAPIAWAWLPANADLFALGMAVALVETAVPLGAVRSFVERHGRWCLPAALAVFWFVSTQLGLPRGLEDATAARELARHLLYGVVGVLAVAPLALRARRDHLGAALGWRPIVWLGAISYGIYVWHLDVIGAAVGWLDGAIGDTWLLGLVTVAVPVSVAIAASSWYLLEQPLLRFRRLGQRNDRVAARSDVSAPVAAEEEVAPAGSLPW